jgi:hypothetical protein
LFHFIRYFECVDEKDAWMAEIKKDFKRRKAESKPTSSASQKCPLTEWSPITVERESPASPSKRARTEDTPYLSECDLIQFSGFDWFDFKDGSFL